ncbi:clan AA aspartic protease [Variovorax paradoxus]|nr:clan AA aspartic protease [Variovorax paradoxus]
MSNSSKFRPAPRYLRLAIQAALAACCIAAMHAAAAAEPVFKCGKTYTNIPAEGSAKARAGGCVLVDTAQPKGKTERIAVDGSMQITVPVGQDGRFWIDGSVNGFPVRFVIDKAATVHAGVVVTEAFAARANLIAGTPAHVQTASGVMDARRIEQVPMTVGPFRVPQATVLVGSLGGKSDSALLGRELLSLFDVVANDREMTLSSK